MTALGRYDTYSFKGAEERLFTVGEGRDILLLPALFAEANRTRAFTVGVARLLAKAGFRACLPDLPGTLESTVTLESVAWSDWEDAVATVVSVLAEPLVVTIRGGALLPTDTSRRLHFAPVSGAKLLRDLARAEAASERDAGLLTGTTALLSRAKEERVEWAGFALTPALTAPLVEVEPVGGAWTVRMSSDAAESNERIEGAPLWRRAEPAMDAAMAGALAQAVVDWSARCAGG